MGIYGRSVRIGIVILPEHRWWAAEPLWRMAEEYGFDHAWTYDQLGWRSLLDKPWFDAIPTLTAAATVTSHIRLGLLVASPNFRHPAHFARELTTVDDVSDGRLTVGLGAGVADFDAHVLGQPELSAQQRVDRFGEFTELLHTILTRDVTDYRGDYFTAVSARRSPGCVQVPRLPFVIAANTEGTMRVAARYGSGWVTTGTQADTVEKWWKSVAESSAEFDEVAAADGRDPATVDRYLVPASGYPGFSLSSLDHFRDMVGRAEELGFTDVIAHWPRPDGPYSGKESVVEEVATEMLGHTHEDTDPEATGLEATDLDDE